MTEVLGPKHQRIIELRRLIGRRSSRSDEVLLEGPRTIGEAVDAGVVPVTVIIPESAADAPGVVALSARLDARVEVLTVRDHVFAKLAPSVTPQPMLALVPRPEFELSARAQPGEVVLVLIDVSDPGNVGTLIRSADAVAATAVVVAGGADPWGSKAVRASAGSVLRVPVISAIEPDVAIRMLIDRGFRVVGTSVDEGQPHDGGVLVSPVAIVLGSESHGIDSSIESLVDAWATITMPGRTESLNVAMAGTLLLYEARRAVRG